MADAKISQLPVATTPLAGTELMEIVQGGVNKQVATSEVGGGGAVDSVNGQTGVVQVNADDVPFTPAGNLSATDVQAAIEELDTEKFSIVQSRRSREITASAAVVQADDNGMIITNSGTPINITLDQLTANLAGNETTKISAKNIGAGAVTFVNGTGVSAVGSLVLPGAVGTNYPTAFIEYETPTAPRVSIGGTESGRVAVAISTGTLTLDINNEIRRDFDLTATETGDFTIAFSNTTNWKESSLTVRLTGTRAITMPSTVRMENFENTVGRWNTSTRVLTLIGVTASPFEIRFSPQGSIIECFATDRFV